MKQAMQKGWDLFLRYVAGYVVDWFGKGTWFVVLEYSWLIMGWIWQESEKTKMSSGNFVGSAIIIGYSKEEWGGKVVSWEGRQVS